jgi:hypothetical protein
VYLFDEPERHLHPHSQREAAAWIADLTRSSNCSAVIATHSLEFLNIPSETASYVKVVRESDGARRARLQPMTDDVLGALRRAADEIGVGPAQFIHLVRGVLVVEGRHDRQVIGHFFGEELRRQRIHMVALHGARKLPALVEAEHLLSLDIPVFVLLDNVRGEALRSRARLQKRAVEDALLEVVRLGRHLNADVRPIPFDPPDVIYALPDDATRRALDEMDAAAARRFPGWTELARRYREARKGAAAGFLPDPKGFPLATELRLVRTKEEASRAASRLIHRTLAQCDESALPSPDLVRAVKRVLAETEAHASRS